MTFPFPPRLLFLFFSVLMTSQSGAQNPGHAVLGANVLLEERIRASDAMAEDFFATSVSASSDRVLVGAPDEDENGSQSGAAYVFEFDGVNWVQTAKLLASDGAADDRFGDSVAVAGNRLLVGASRGDGLVTDSGAVYIFERQGMQWVEMDKIFAADGVLDDRFGISVSGDGDRILVGADFDDDLGGQSGSAYIFELTLGVWREQQKLLATDGAAIANFGLSVSLSGDRALIGAPGDDESGLIAGAAYIFDLLAGVWQQTDKLLADDGAFGDGLGIAVGLAQNGQRALVGSPGSGATGAAYVFDYDTVQWNQTVRLTPQNGASGALFGEALSLSTDSALIGAPSGNGVINGSGTAYLFSLNAGIWSQEEQLSASDGDLLDQFGSAVAHVGDVLVIGANEDDDQGDEAGSAYIFYAAANLTLEATGPAQVIAGETVDGGFLVSNRGPSTARDVVLNVATNPALSLITAGPPCMAGFPCTIGDMASGETLQVTVSYAVPRDASGVIMVTGDLASPTIDPTAGNESASWTTAVIREADLVITKTGPAAAAAGEILTYQLVIDNLGPSMAQGLILTETPDAELSFISAGAPCAAGFPCALGDLAAGGSLQLNVQYQVQNGFTGMVNNTVTIGSLTTDPQSTNNTDTAMTLVDVLADVAIVKSGPVQAVAGELLTYTLTVNNLGPMDAPEVIVDDPTPTGVTLQSIMPPCDGGFPCNLGVLANAASVAFDVTFNVPADAAGGVINNTAVVSSSANDINATNNISSVSTAVVAQADVGLTATSAMAVNAGESFQLTLTVDNTGPSQAQSVQINHPLTGGLQLQSISAPCAGGFPCTVPLLDVNAMLELTLTYSAPADLMGTVDLSFSATAATPDPQLVNNDAQLDLPVVRRADLSVDKRSGAAHVDAGGVITYTISVLNHGVADATGVRVLDTPPARLGSLSWTCQSSGGAVCAAAGVGLIDEIVDVPVAGTIEFLLSGQLIDNDESGEITNRVELIMPVGITDPLPQDNQDEDTDVIALFADSFESGS